VTLAHAIQALAGVEASDESSSAQERAFYSTKKKDFGKQRFVGKCFYNKNIVHKEIECNKKKADEGRGQVTQARASDFAFMATSAMAKTE